MSILTNTIGFSLFGNKWNYFGSVSVSSGAVPVNQNPTTVPLVPLNIPIFVAKLVGTRTRVLGLFITWFIHSIIYAIKINCVLGRIWVERICSNDFSRYTNSKL
jgi:hypothetical protein